MENIIKIEGGAYTDVKKALRQWISLYSENIDESLKFEVFKNGKGNHVIRVDERIDITSFFYLINYLKYPENIKYKINVEGFTIGKEHVELLDKRLLIYISENDKNYDNVYVVTEENKTYTIDFGGKITELPNERKYAYPKLNDLSNPEILKVRKKEKSINEIQEDRKSIHKRFKIISLISLLLICLSYLALLDGTVLFVQTTFFIGIGIATWFFSDYKMLRVNTFYFFSLLIAFIYLAYGFILKQVFPGMKVELISLGAFFPLSLLIIQRPLRLLYITIFKKEPIIINVYGTLRDFAYTIILFLSLIAIPFLIADFLK